ncbi:MAG TPA: DNA repair protein RecN [Nitrospiraceae bacterium]|nr:DNA repair protein RecN [Nitrospiraceae bacterium]
MLTELRITNFAVLEQLSLSVDSGFTVLTGETGAGKSLLIDAIALLVGGRASTDQIRFGEDEAQLEAAFQIPTDHPILRQLRAQGILGPEESQLIIRRVIARSGRNRVYLNGAMTPVHVLEEFGGTLVDIHGQHDQQSLLSTSTQLEVLDAFGQLRELRGQYQSAYGEWIRFRQERAGLAGQIEQRAEREDYLQFQRQELDDAALHPGEEEALQNERRRLGSAHRLSELASEAQERMQAESYGILPNLALMERALGELAQIDQEMQDAGRLAAEAKVLLKEVADGLRGYADRLDADPARLNVIEDRLAVIQKLKKKYGGTVEAVLETHRRVRDELALLEQSDVQLEQCDRLIREQRQNVSRLARQLSGKRSEAARRMTKVVRQELDALKMGQTGFLIQIITSEGDEAYGSDGADRAEFLLSTNVGEPLKPISRVASGGELSRVMLALKSVLAEVDEVPVLIFDEIDNGVGGAVAAAIGKRLRALGRFHQVFCITHLPQVASQAQHHLCVEKSQVKDRTVTTVRSLTGMSRESEIARMLGGETVTKKVRETAAELIAGAND